jgi:hypothetical protein
MFLDTLYVQRIDLFNAGEQQHYALLAGVGPETDASNPSEACWSLFERQANQQNPSNISWTENPLIIRPSSRVFAGWNHTDSHWISNIWPAGCPNCHRGSDGQAPETHKYHWHFIWKAEDEEEDATEDDPRDSSEGSILSSTTDKGKELRWAYLSSLALVLGTLTAMYVRYSRSVESPMSGPQDSGYKSEG